MIVKLIVLVALAASPALGSAGIKGYTQQREEAKGGRLLTPIEQHRLEATKSAEKPPQQQWIAAEHREEQRELPSLEQKQEEFHQQREEVRQEAPKGYRYEARPQVREEQLEPPTKGLKSTAQKEEILSAPKEDQKQLAEAQPTKSIKTVQREEPLVQLAQKEEHVQEQLVQREVKGLKSVQKLEEPLVQREEKFEQPKAIKSAPKEEAAPQFVQQREERYEQRESPTKSIRKEQGFIYQQRTEQIEQQRETLPTRSLKTQEPFVQKEERFEQRELPTKTAKREEQQLVQQLPVQKEEIFEQQQREFDAPQQAVDIRPLIYEQRRTEDAGLVQSAIVEDARDIQQQREVSQQQLEAYPTKGAAPAPIGEAEPYAFNYQVEGSSRTESGDTKGVVRGQYTVQGADGSSRVVDYIADKNGFRASVNTNELGTESKSPAGVAVRTSQPNAEDLTLRLEGKTRESVAASLPVAPLAVKAPAVPAKPDNWQVKGQPLLVQTPVAPPQQFQTVQQTQLIYEDAAKGVTKRTEEVKTFAAPAKGQRLEESFASTSEFVQEPAKSAELKAPAKLPTGELKHLAAPSETRSVGFESATAHRNLKEAPLLHARPVAIRAQPVGVVRAPAPVTNRRYLQRERYPPSPVQGYRRNYEVHPANVVAGSPRVSFYSQPASAPVENEDFDLPVEQA